MTPQELAAHRQQEFDSKYITSTEVCERLAVNRSSITNAKKSGLLPEPIQVGGLKTFVWVRSDVEEHLRAWKIILDTKRKARVCQ